MSESAGSASAGATTSAASANTNTSSAGVTQATSSISQSTQSSTPSTTHSPSAASSKGSSTSKSTESHSSDGGDGFEEIKLGSVAGRVSKEIAQAIKNYERGFNTKAQEAAQSKRLLELAKENPKEFFKQTGKDAYEFAEQLLAEKYEDMTMDPKDRELRDLRREKTQREETERASKKEVLDALKEFGEIPKGAENASREELIQYLNHQKETYNKTWNSLDSEIGGAFKEAGLPADKHLLAKVAFEMSSALKRGKSLSAQEAVAKVNKEWFDGAKQTFGQMDVKRIHEVFGDEFFDKLRKYDLDRVTADAASKFGQNGSSPVQTTASSSGQKKVLNQSEWRKAMGLT